MGYSGYNNEQQDRLVLSAIREFHEKRKIPIEEEFNPLRTKVYVGEGCFQRDFVRTGSYVSRELRFGEYREGFFSSLLGAKPLRRGLYSVPTISTRGHKVNCVLPRLINLGLKNLTRSRIWNRDYTSSGFICLLAESPREMAMLSGKMTQILNENIAPFSEVDFGFYCDTVAVLRIKEPTGLAAKLSKYLKK